MNYIILINLEKNSWPYYNKINNGFCFDDILIKIELHFYSNILN